MAEFYTSFGLAAEADDRRFERNLLGAEVRFEQAFTAEDFLDVHSGKVVYPEQSLRLAEGGKLITTGSVVLEVNSEGVVTKLR